MEQTAHNSRVDQRSRRSGAEFESTPLRTVRLIAGDATTTVRNDGANDFTVRGIAVNRSHPDAECGCPGTIIYLRDLESGQFWALGRRPAGQEPQAFSFETQTDSVRIQRQDYDIAASMQIHVTADGVEWRRLTLANSSNERRRIEVTSYLEWVLQHREGDAGHPAFSKLFVETAYDPARKLITARRRRREPQQEVLLGAHWIADADGLIHGDIQAESNRKFFIGRGRDYSAPQALVDNEPLSSQFGPVLDPCASLRAIFYLAPDESAVITFATLAAEPAERLQLPVQDHYARVDSAHKDHRPLSAEIDGHAQRVDGAHRRKNIGRSTFQPLSISDAARPKLDGHAPPTLQFDNGFGGFTPDGREYVIRVRVDGRGALKLPPLPWSHVVASPTAGFIATETGVGSSWTLNSRENRLTPWANDPVCDPPSEALFLREPEKGVYWSLTPAPAGRHADYTVRYGFGYAAFEHAAAGFRHKVVHFVPRSDSVKLARITLTNEDAAARKLDLFHYAQLSLGNGSTDPNLISTWRDDATGAIFATNPDRSLSGRIAFSALMVPTATGLPQFTCDRREFLGPNGRPAEPQAIRSTGELSGRSGDGLDPCAALETSFQIPAHGQIECLAILGEADTEDAARRLIQKYSAASAAAMAFDEVTRYWRQILSAVEADTPSPELNLLINGWLPFQNLSCRMWGRSAYYQSGGAFGFRDQLQDSSALVYHSPDITRNQILLHASHQFIEGDVLHWWHPPTSGGIRTRFSDDLLWLPLLAAEYAQSTGDVALWDQQARLLCGPALNAGEQERFFVPEDSGKSISIYDHCCLAIDRSLAVGARGLPLMGCGDWNDGMNRVGQHGRGESVWMGFFLYTVLERMLPVCRERGDHDRSRKYAEHQTHLKSVLNTSGWDGQWYLRAFFDDGTPLGSADSEECRIDALVQAWAVLSGAGDPEKTVQAVAAAEKELVDDRAGLIRLLNPPLDRIQNDPGYIRSYLPGVRENGGQYTHGVLWFIRAVAQMGRGSRAVELLEMLTPVRHGSTPQSVETYQAEPYVVAADVYGEPPHVGRAGWTWYTGSAGWMWRVAVESILGLSVRNGTKLVLNPCISAKWPQCSLTYRLPDGGEYQITIHNPNGKERGVRSATVDGEAVEIDQGVAHVPLCRDGRSHQVSLHL